MTDQQFREIKDLLERIESNTSTISTYMPSSTINDLDNIHAVLEKILNALKE